MRSAPCEKTGPSRAWPPPSYYSRHRSGKAFASPFLREPPLHGVPLATVETSPLLARRGVLAERRPSADVRSGPRASESRRRQRRKPEFFQCPDLLDRERSRPRPGTVSTGHVRTRESSSLSWAASEGGTGWECETDEHDNERALEDEEEESKRYANTFPLSHPTRHHPLLVPCPPRTLGTLWRVPLMRRSQGVRGEGGAEGRDVMVTCLGHLRCPTVNWKSVASTSRGRPSPHHSVRQFRLPVLLRSAIWDLDKPVANQRRVRLVLLYAGGHLC